MKAIEIIEMWNKELGTRFPKNEGSSIRKEIERLSEKFGEKTVTDYFFKKVKEGKSDIWEFAIDYKIDEYQKSLKPEINALEILGEQLVSLMGVQLADKITEKVKARIDEYVENKVISKVYEYKDEQRKINGIAHEKLEYIIKFIAMDEPVIMVGPAGTGKNVIAKQAAEALGLNFYFSNAVTQEYKITGYGDANGNYVKTQFYEAFTKGGLFLLDEMDASCPESLVILNAAIANRYFDFPVIGRVEAHKDFRVIACANTFGTGASLEYVGRNQLDAATLNRFAIEYIDYDKKIEDALCPDKELASFLREFRKNCQNNGINHIVSYREFNRCYKMIELAKMDAKEVIQTCLIKGMEEDSLRMVVNSISNKYANIFK